jgi:hypothetical protein
MPRRNNFGSISKSMMVPILIAVVVISVSIYFFYKKSHAEVAEKAVDTAIVAQNDAVAAKDVANVAQADANNSKVSQDVADSASQAAKAAQADANKKIKDAENALAAARALYPQVSEVSINLNGNKALQIHNITLYDEMNKPIDPSNFKLSASAPYNNDFAVDNAIKGRQDNHQPYISQEKKGSSTFNIIFTNPVYISKVDITNRLNCPGECQERLSGAVLSLKLVDGSDMSRLLTKDIDQSFVFKTSDGRYKTIPKTIGSGAQYNCPGAAGVVNNGNWCQFTKLSDAQNYCNNPDNNCAGFSQQIGGGNFQVISKAQLNMSPNNLWNFFQKL